MGDVGNNGAYARLRAQATSMRRKAESVGNKLQAIAEGIAKKYGARVTPINYKSVDSIVRKAKGEANGIKKTLRTRTEQPSSQIKGQYRK